MLQLENNLKIKLCYYVHTCSAVCDIMFFFCESRSHQSCDQFTLESNYSVNSYIPNIRSSKKSELSTTTCMVNSQFAPKSVHFVVHM